MKPPSQSITASRMETRESIKENLHTMSEDVTQRGQEVDQRRNMQQQIVEQGADQNVLSKPFTGALDAVIDKGKK